MAGTKKNPAGGSGFQKPKSDKGGENEAQPMGPATNPIWDLFNLLMPTGGMGGETTVQGGGAGSAFAPDNTVMPGRIPGMQSQPAPAPTGQPAPMMNQPTQSVPASEVFGDAFSGHGQFPPMPQQNPAFASDRNAFGPGFNSIDPGLPPPQPMFPVTPPTPQPGMRAANPPPTPTANPAFHAQPGEVGTPIPDDLIGLLLRQLAMNGG